MMSCFLDILRCIVCYEDEERPRRSENLSYYENTRVPNYGSFSRTISPTTDSPSRKQWNIEQTTSTSPKIQQKSYPDSSYTSTGFSRESNDIFSSARLAEVLKPSYSATLSGYNPKNSTVISQNFARKTATLSSTSEKLGEGAAKGKVSPLMQSPVKAFQHDSTYSKNVLIEGNISDALKLDASQKILKKSHESYDQKPDDLLSFASSASLTSSPLITKLGRSSILEKSSNVSQKPKDLPSTMAPNCTFQTKETKTGTKKTIDQKPSQAVSSASSQSSKSFPKLQASSNSLKPSISIIEHPPSSLKSDSPLSSTPFPACLSAKLTPRSIKPALSLAPSSTAAYGTKASYVWVEKGASPTYVCPDDIKSLIEKDIVPRVLKERLSMSTYKKFFQALLYAEDIYLEKWDGFEMKDVTLQLHKAAIHMRKGTIPRLDVKKVDKTFVAFEVDKIPEKRPFLLSRDFVTVRPLRNKIKTFEGIIYRVIRSNLVLAEFGENFHRQHDPSGVYDVTFSFNRVCLKRAHQAILAASDDLLRNFLFPNSIPGNKLHSAEPYGDHIVGKKEACALRQILSLQGAPPYLVQGPLSITRYEINQLSKSGVVIVDTILQICRTSSSNRILLCAPTNKTCDAFMRALKKEIPESDMFRANAAFRELDGVPSDILPSCLYEEEQECFSCPSLEELCKFKVILSTFMSSFRLRNVGIVAGHFSHIFLVDASSATEPETLVPLAHFTNERTSVVVTGAPGNHSTWVRSNIARQNGLRISYFERLCESRLYENLDPYVITILENPDQNFNHTSGSFSFY